MSLRDIQALRRITLSSLIAAITVLLGSCAACAEPNSPTALVFLWESGGWGSPPGPWPYGLRFVLYDDGQVIYSSDSFYLPEGKQPTYVIGHLTPAEAKAFALDIATKLRKAPTEIRGDPGMFDAGWTTLQVKTDMGNGEVTYSAYGQPCKASGRQFADEWEVSNRQGTDARFLDVCDALSMYQLPDALAWQPAQLWIFLTKSDGKPDQIIARPEDWPQLMTNKATGQAAVCLQLDGRLSDLTKAMLTPPSTSSPWGAGFQDDHASWWVINDWEFALPGKIRISYSPFHNSHGNCEALPVDQLR